LESPESPNYVEPRKLTTPVSQNRFLVKSGILSDVGTIITTSGATGLVLAGSGSETISAATVDATSGPRFGWFLNYGQSSSKAIYNLNEITAPGTYVLTAVARYNTTGAPALVTRRVSVTIISEADAIARAAAEIKPGTLLANGDVTAATVDLSNATSVIGVNVRWEIAGATGTGFGTSTVKDGNSLNLVSIKENGVSLTARAQQLSITRNYSDQKFFLRGTLVKGYLQPRDTSGVVAITDAGFTTFTGSNTTRTYEFTVKANSLANLTIRAEGLLKDNFIKTPLFISLPNSGNTLIDSSTIVQPAGSGVYRTSGLDVINVRYDFASVPTGYYVLPFASGVVGATAASLADPLSASGITHYMIVSGTAPSTIVVQSGTITLANYNGSGLFLLNAANGQIDVVDATQFPSAATKVATFEASLVARVLLSTDTVPTTYNVNKTIAHPFTVFKNS
jgi:hypothetical protein